MLVGRPVTGPRQQGGVFGTLFASDSDWSLPSKFLENFPPTPTPAGGNERSSPVHCLPPPEGVGRVSVAWRNPN